VLWIVVLLGYLSARHAAHNRDKAGVAMDAMERIRVDQTVRSIVDLFGTGKSPIPETQQAKWMQVSIGDAEVWVRLDSEKKRIAVSAANDGKLRQLVQSLLEETEESLSDKELALKGDEIVDALLDWVDEDDLRRLNGAEADDYLAAGLNYVPSDAPFRTLSEMLLVLGMSESFFWGQPIDALIADLEDMADEASGLGAVRSVGMGRRKASGGLRSRTQGERTERTPDFWDAVTVYSKSVHRLTMIGTGNRNGYWMAVVLFESKGKSPLILEDIRLHFPSEDWRPALEGLMQRTERMKNPPFKRVVAVDR